VPVAAKPAAESAEAALLASADGLVGRTGAG
jgi:hypothetical protein